MDATQGAWNLEAPEGTGGRKAEAFETAGKESRKAAHGSKERAAVIFDIFIPHKLPLG